VVLAQTVAPVRVRVNLSRLSVFGQETIAIDPAGHQAVLDLAFLIEGVDQEKPDDQQEQNERDPGETGGLPIRIGSRMAIFGPEPRLVHVAISARAVPERVNRMCRARGKHRD
jgi:hypothetical protein